MLIPIYVEKGNTHLCNMPAYIHDADDGLSPRVSACICTLHNQTNYNCHQRHGLIQIYFANTTIIWCIVLTWYFREISRLCLSHFSMILLSHKNLPTWPYTGRTDMLTYWADTVTPQSNIHLIPGTLSMAGCGPYAPVNRAW